MEYLIKIGIEGLKRVLNNKGFSETAETKQLIKEFNENNNPVIEYVDFLENEADNSMKLEYIIEHYSCTKIYNGDYDWQKPQERITGFKDWLSNNGLKAISFNNFIKNMKQNFNLKTERKMRHGRKETYFYLSGH